MLLHGDHMPLPSYRYSNAQPNAPAAENPQKAFNVCFHYIEADGTVLTPQELAGRENDALKVIRNLNVGFNGSNIFFKSRGFDYIPESDYLDVRTDDFVPAGEFPSLGELREYSDLNGYYKSHTLNIFIVNKINQLIDGSQSILPGIIQGFANADGAVMPNIFVMKNYFTGAVTVHEMGHAFGLEHTNRNGFGPQANGATYCEHVPRFGLEGYNANEAGDYIDDTFASPSEYQDSDVDNFGNFVGNGVDCTGLYAYNLFGTQTVPIKNFMNVNREEDIQFQNHFTPGQFTKAVEFIQDNASEFAYWQTPTTDLYQPFDVRDVRGSMITIGNNEDDNATAIVCYQRLVQNRFQPGFSYEFPDSQNGDIENAAIEEVPVIKYNTGEFRVKIAQLDDHHYEYVPVDCTRGLWCDEEAFIGGTLFSMAVLGSMNVTIAELTRAQATNPRLYEELLSQYYYVLRRMTETGQIREEIFYKP